MVLALPPHFSSVGRENLIGSKRAVLLCIPLFGDFRVLNGEIVCCTQFHSIAVGARAMTIGAVITGGEIVMRRVVRTCPPIQFAGSIGYIFGSDPLILVVVPFLGEFREFRCEGVGYRHFSPETV